MTSLESLIGALTVQDLAARLNISIQTLVERAHQDKTGLVINLPKRVPVQQLTTKVGQQPPALSRPTKKPARPSTDTLEARVLGHLQGIQGQQNILQVLESVRGPSETVKLSSVRSVLNRLIQAGQVVAQGKTRARTYAAKTGLRTPPMRKTNKAATAQKAA